MPHYPIPLITLPMPIPERPVAPIQKEIARVSREKKRKIEIRHMGELEGDKVALGEHGQGPEDDE